MTTRDKAILAEACLRIESARQYGFISGGPIVDVAACEAAIAEASEAGFTFTEDDVDQAVVEMVAELVS